MGLVVGTEVGSYVVGASLGCPLTTVGAVVVGADVGSSVTMAVGVEVLLPDPLQTWAWAAMYKSHDSGMSIS